MTNAHFQPRGFPRLNISLSSRPSEVVAGLHRAAYAAMNLPFTYTSVAVEDFEAAIAGARALGVRGIGVGVPFKLRAFAVADVVHPEARAVGAVNTLVDVDGRLEGWNVDIVGARRALVEVASVRSARFAVVGAGGAARAIAQALREEGAEVQILARDPGRARAMTEALGLPEARVFDAGTDLAAFDGVANATPVGFHDPSQSPFDADRLRPGQILFDAVVGSDATRLFRDAAAAGCRVVAGPRMLVHVIAEQIALYTGQRPDLAVLERALTRPPPPSGA
jgi:shikimate dehydrogenase